ncbi:SdpI family protein [Kytococcus sedentarius]|uniref:SdpI family protein n=1 Tax=Kytococcus sedentarius TaxID=1276 RepID=UPI00384E278B
MCLVALGILGPVVHGVCRSAAEGDLRNNAVVGLRTPATRKTERTWRAAHRSALPLTRPLAVVVPSVAGIAAVATLVTGREDVAAAGAVGVAAVLGSVTILAGVRGHVVARRVFRDREAASP